MVSVRNVFKAVFDKYATTSKLYRSICYICTYGEHIFFPEEKKKSKSKRNRASDYLEHLVLARPAACILAPFPATIDLCYIALAPSLQESMSAALCSTAKEE